MTIDEWAEQLRAAGTITLPADWDITFGDLDDICRVAGALNTTIHPIADDGTIEVTAERFECQHEQSESVGPLMVCVGCGVVTANSQL